MMLAKIIYSAYVLSLAIGSFVVARIGATIASFFRVPTPLAFQTAGHLWGRFVVFIMRIKIEVRGKRNIPRNTPLIFASNHQSIFDVILLQAVIPVRFRFVIASELLRLPLYGWTFKKSGYITLERGSPLSAHKVVERTVEALNSGACVLVFPEGTRSRTGKLGEFKSGSLLPAQKSGIPVIPVASSGTFDVFRPRTLLVSRHPVKVNFGKPVYIRPEDDLPQKTEEIKKTIAGML